MSETKWPENCPVCERKLTCWGWEFGHFVCTDESGERGSGHFGCRKMSSIHGTAKPNHFFFWCPFLGFEGEEMTTEEFERLVKLMAFR